MYVIIEWLIQNWDMIVDIFMWALTFLMAFILVAKIYKIVKLNFEVADAVGLFFVGLWVLLIVIFGFDHMSVYLKSFL